ncbi:MAG: S-adenosylmethionine:tRNA ribosyltransferase-isomerase, partial [Holophagaceae bacterium]
MALRSDFNFNLPPHLIAQRPLADRESSKLLVIHPDQGIVAHSSVRELHQWLS